MLYDADLTYWIFLQVRADIPVCVHVLNFDCAISFSQYSIC